MGKSLAIGLVICIVLLLLLLNMDDYFSNLNATYCSGNLESTYCYKLMP